MKYKVLKDWGDFKAGDEADSSTFNESITPEVLSALIVDGTLDPIVDPSLYETIKVDEAYLEAHPDEEAQGIMLGDEITRPVAVPAEAPAAEAEAAPEKKLVYNGQEVISDGMREVNGVEYHHVRLTDGSSMDVSDDEYEAMVRNVQ